MPTHGLTLPTPLKSPATATPTYERDPIEALRESLQSDDDATSPNHDADGEADDDNLTGATRVASDAVVNHHHHNNNSSTSTSTNNNTVATDATSDSSSAAAVIAAASAAAHAQLQQSQQQEQQHQQTQHHNGNNATAPNSVSKSRFRYEAERVLLSGPDDLDLWLAQTEAIATATNCFSELTQQFNVATFPPDGTVMALICSARFTTAWRILEDTISGPVWAMMRVFQLQAHYKSHMLPNQIYEFARWVASRMPTVGTNEQPQEERMAMVTEYNIADPAYYPNQRCYEEGVQFLQQKLHELMRLGDWRVAAAMYDEIPDWCPKPPPGMTDEDNQHQQPPEHPQDQQAVDHQQSNGKTDYSSPYPPLPSGQQDGHDSPQTVTGGYPAPPIETTTTAAIKGEPTAVVRDDQPPPNKRRRGRPSKYA
ncbi:hypothetical protein PspLS_08906 [Pyricularia sp. CBS 133598]|nr:hypothetical protein PspLS_08906 [Pyricularia sp. CBS 133598]